MRNIKVIQNKISKSIGKISEAKYLLSSRHLKQLYQTLTVTHLNYCRIIWSSHNQNTAFEKLNLVKKRAIRLIAHSVARANTKFLFYKQNLLNVIYTTNVNSKSYYLFEGYQLHRPVYRWYRPVALLKLNDYQ